MIRKLILMTSLMALPIITAGEAQAREYCREYTKTIYVGGKAVEGYGTACRQDDGAWEISQLEGPDKAQTKVREYIVDDLRDQGARNIVIVNDRHYTPRTSTVVYYNNGRSHKRYNNHRRANYSYKHNNRYNNKNYKRGNSHNSRGYKNNSRGGFSINYSSRY